MPKLAVAIASLGRPESLGQVCEALQKQTRPADRLLLSVTNDNDLPDPLPFSDIEVVQGSKGLCAQRNRAVEHLRDDVDYLIFLDDDYVPSRFALERIEAFFEANPDIVGIMGDVLADGIKGPGISYAKACELVAAYDQAPRPEIKILSEVDGLYGCNMCFRVSAIQDTRFDENLPLYGWLEDNDFSNQLLRVGRLVHTNAFAGVHCGVKAARSPGVRLGYSQIANPIYLSRKGTLPWRKALRLMSRNLIANHALTLKPEPWVDRWGRTKGNWLAFRHLLTGKLTPQHIVGL